jgi:hypothetical protein
MTASPKSSFAQDDPISVARRYYQAYIDNGFHFTSPLDNRIDRQTYFARCWPNSENAADFNLIHLVQDEDRVFVTYEGRGRNGHISRNTEILTVQYGKLVSVEVYFGWSLPHEAQPGGFINAATQS